MGTFHGVPHFRLARLNAEIGDVLCKHFEPRQDIPATLSEGVFDEERYSIVHRQVQERFQAGQDGVDARHFRVRNWEWVFL